MSQIPQTNDFLPTTILPAGTYFYGLGGDAALINSVHLKWDATLVATITFESSNFPDVALNSVVVGDWIAETAIATISPASAASGTMTHVGNHGAQRLRIKVVVATLGTLRGRANGKD